MVRKSLFRKFVFTLTAVMLLTCSSIRAAELETTPQISLPTGDMAERKLSDPIVMLSPEEAQRYNQQMAGYERKETSHLINRAETYYYYEHLDPVARQIYDVLFEVLKDPVSEDNIGLMMTNMDPASAEFYYEFNVASRAICFDHPELFWLYAGTDAEISFLSEALMQNGFYFVYFRMREPFEHFEEQMTAFNLATEEFLSDIDTGISEYETVRQIHDKLIRQVTYDTPAAEGPDPPVGQDLAHTAYGALVADSAGNPHYAVCDGYSLAFEYLVQQCGIEALFIGGNAGNTEWDAGLHAWNMVKLDGNWYEVDCTWDDVGEGYLDGFTPEMESYDYYMEALGDLEYREKLDHYLFLLSTENMRHYVPDIEMYYITKDGRHAFPLIFESVHIRLNAEEMGLEENPGSILYMDSMVISLAPQALWDYL